MQNIGSLYPGPVRLLGNVILVAIANAPRRTEVAMRVQCGRPDNAENSAVALSGYACDACRETPQPASQPGHRALN